MLSLGLCIQVRTCMYMITMVYDQYQVLMVFVLIYVVSIIFITYL